MVEIRRARPDQADTLKAIAVASKASRPDGVL